MSGILYEHPLNERMRVLLRLETYFAQAQHFLQQDTIWDTQACLSTLIDMISALERSDIRSEVIKELERQAVNLSRLLNTPGVNYDCLQQTLNTLNQQLEKMHTFSAKLNPSFKSHELFSSVRQRFAIQGGLCAFDLPAYHYWLHQPRSVKVEQFMIWLGELQVLEDSITVVLALIRESHLFEPINAHSGAFEKVLDPKVPCQMLRIIVPPHYPVYPEVSGSKHRAHIRFLEYANTGRPQQTQLDIECEVSFCVL
jgi:cell division protein ZapD